MYVLLTVQSYNILHKTFHVVMDVNLMGPSIRKMKQMIIFYSVQWPNKCTIISQIITLLHASTLSCHRQGSCNQYLAQLHMYVKCSCWQYNLKLIIISNNFKLSLKYLETTLTNKNSIAEEIKSRLRSGNACYHSVQNLFVFQAAIQKYKDQDI